MKFESLKHEAKFKNYLKKSIKYLDWAEMWAPEEVALGLKDTLRKLQELLKDDQWYALLAVNYYGTAVRDNSFEERVEIGKKLDSGEE